MKQRNPSATKCNGYLFSPRSLAAREEKARDIINQRKLLRETQAKVLTDQMESQKEKTHTHNQVISTFK